MALDNERFEEQDDLARFLDKFKEPDFLTEEEWAVQNSLPSQEPSQKPLQKDESFEKLERKIQELEERFDASEEQSERILQELSQTRESVERQRNKDAFLEHLSQTIANLKASVENLSRAQQEQSFASRQTHVQREFDSFSANTSKYEPASYRPAPAEPQDQTEKERIISSLHYKTSQLKAVNSALDREIKKVQQEKMEALKKSAEQAKEILSLRDQLTQAEERFKSFNFEDRIISVRQEYEQRVSSLETQLKEISDTCMKQVEEIETLRAENIKLQQAAAEKEQVITLLEEKERELQSLKEQMATLKEQNQKQSQQQQQLFAEQIRTLEAKRGELTAQFEAAQNDLQSVRSEKEVLEQNFRALMEKINNNDSVLEQLKQKIDVLAKQNETLAQHNEQLVQDNQQLAQDNEQLTQDNAHLSQHNSQLVERTKELEQDNHILADANHTLSAEKQRLEKQQASQPRKAPIPPVLRKITKTPTAPLLPKGSATVNLNEKLHLDNSATEKIAAPQSSKPLSAQEPLENEMLVPVTNKQKQAKREEDLPEIKTAEPMPQPEVSLDKDDFLEKTDSFLGRFKWSIFHEDR